LKDRYEAVKCIKNKRFIKFK